MNIRYGIYLDKLVKRFGLTTAIDSLTLAVEPGLLHGVIGPDGAGKTTLLRLMAGLLRPAGGTITFTANGENADFEHVRPQLAYMPSRQSLYPDLSIEEHLEFFKSLYQLAPDIYRERASRLLGITRLERFRGRKVGQLSGGMYKKVGLMCALLRSPAVLLLDEPTNGVDPISRREFWELLYQLSGEHILILISTAYMDEAERCSRVHLLDSGRCIASGEPAQVLAGEKVQSFDELWMKRA